MPPVGQPATAVPVPSYVPPQWRAWVAQAAAGTGLPTSVVAAQINLESGFNANATSSTGAEGAAQIEPATWKGLGIPGTPYQPIPALHGYEKDMSQLLAQFHGNVRDALAAYNAGAGNIAAGYGYADTILGKAGRPSSSASTSTSASSSSAGAYGGLGGFLLKLVLTLGLLFAGVVLAWEGVNGVFGDAPRRAGQRVGLAAAVAA